MALGRAYSPHTPAWGGVAGLLQSVNGVTSESPVCMCMCASAGGQRRPGGWCHSGVGARAGLVAVLAVGGLGRKRRARRLWSWPAPPYHVCDQQQQPCQSPLYMRINYFFINYFLIEYVIQTFRPLPHAQQCILCKPAVLLFLAFLSRALSRFRCRCFRIHY